MRNQTKYLPFLVFAYGKAMGRKPNFLKIKLNLFIHYLNINIMRKYIKCLPFLVFAACITSCDNEDKMLNPDSLKASAKAARIEAKSGGTIDVDLGGPNEPNNVYIDLSTGNTKVVRRDAWELGFYNGDKNRVFLNASILVTAAKTEFTNIDSVSRSSKFTKPMKLKSLGVFGALLPRFFKPREVTVENVEQLIEGLPLELGMYGSPSPEEEHPEKTISFTDNQQGTLDGTALGEIASDASQAKVYIVSAGYEVPGTKPGKGSIETKGAQRGFYKIKVFMKEGQYVIQYAPLEATDHKEVVTAKDDNYNLTFFSLVHGKTVEAVAPPKAEFDINFAGVFGFYGYETSHIDGKKYWAGVAYSDYALTNNLGGTGVYSIHTQKWDESANTYIPANEPSYEAFTRADIVEGQFVYDDRSVIDSHWRRAFPPRRLIPGVYYLIKDSAGNIYKLKFTGFLGGDQSKERGYPQFEYKLLK